MCVCLCTYVTVDVGDVTRSLTAGDHETNGTFFNPMIKIKLKLCLKLSGESVTTRGPTGLCVRGFKFILNTASAGWRENLTAHSAQEKRNGDDERKTHRRIVSLYFELFNTPIFSTHLKPVSV